MAACSCLTRLSQARAGTQTVRTVVSETRGRQATLSIWSITQVSCKFMCDYELILLLDSSVGS